MAVLLDAGGRWAMDSADEANDAADGLGDGDGSGDPKTVVGPLIDDLEHVLLACGLGGFSGKYDIALCADEDIDESETSGFE